MTLQTTPLPTLPPPTPALPVPPVRVGSRFDAKQLRARIQEALRGAELLDDRVRLMCTVARERAIYKLLEDGRGKYFASWSDFCCAPQPWGLGLDPGMLAELAREQADPRRRARLALEGPLAMRKRGGQPGHASTQGGPARARKPRLYGGDYVLQRLRRDFPHLLARVATGELPNIKAAALEAGLTRPMLTCRYEPVAVARMVVTRFDPAQRREIAELVTRPETIPAPRNQRSAAWRRFQAEALGPEAFARQEAEREAATKQREAERRRERLAAPVGTTS